MAAHGQQLEDHERRLGEMSGDIKDLSKTVGDARVELSQSVSEIRAIRDDMKNSSRRTALIVGSVLTVANIAVDAGILLYLH